MEVSLPSVGTLPFLWLDAKDEGTIRSAGNYVKSWKSKGSIVASARGAPFSVQTRMLPVTTVPVGEWRNAIVSKSGQGQLVFSDFGGPVFLSQDYGQTFRSVPELTNAVQQVYMEAAISDDGRVIVVCLFDGPLTVSRDGGLTWTLFPLASMGLWEWCSLSADGTFALATAQGDGIFLSTDGCQTFTQLSLDPQETELGFVYVSPTGDHQYVGYYGGPLVISSNKGRTFEIHPQMVLGNWSDIAVQKTEGNTGTYLVIFESPGYVWISQDSAGTWTAKLTDRRREWLASSVSGSGATIVVAETDGLLYISKNFGETFAVTIDTTPRRWSGVFVGMDGEITAVGDGIPIYSSSNDGSTWTSGRNFSVKQDVSLSGLGASWDGRTLLVAEHGARISVSSKSSEPTLVIADRRRYVKFSVSALTLDALMTASEFTAFLF